MKEMGPSANGRYCLHHCSSDAAIEEHILRTANSHSKLQSMLFKDEVGFFRMVNLLLRRTTLAFHGCDLSLTLWVLFWLWRTEGDTCKQVFLYTTKILQSLWNFENLEHRKQNTLLVSFPKCVGCPKCSIMKNRRLGRRETRAICQLRLSWWLRGWNPGLPSLWAVPDEEQWIG